MKRYFTLLLSVFMVLGAMGFPAAVSALELPLEQEQLPDKKVIVKFNDAMIAAWKGMEAGTYTEEDGRQITAAKMAPGALNADGQRATKDYPNPRYLLADYGIDTDMSGYRTINFRLYSKAATNEQVNIVLQQTKNGSDGYFKQTITLDWIGWKTFSYHFGDMSPTKAGISEKRIGTIYFNFGGWGTGKTGNAETELAVSEIYLSNPHNEVKLEDGLIAWEAGTTENCTPFTSDSTVTNMHDVSGKMVIDKTGDISLTTPNRHLVVDSQQYQYLNLLVHSNKATTTAGTGINICVFDYAGSNSYVRKNIPVNWTGWKVVSIPLSQFNSSRWNQVKSIRINSGGWSGSVKPVEIGTELNFDLIWFSKEEPNLKLKETIAETGSTEMSAAGAEVSFQFSNPLRRIDETKLTLTKQGETNSESIFCTAEGSTMTLAAQGTLEYGTAYTLTVLTGAVTDIFGQSNTEPITYSFTTMQQGLNATPPTLTDSAGNPLTAMPENGETVKAAARVSNGTSAAKTATLVLAYYDENNTMVDCKTASKSIPANGIDTLEATTTASGTVVKAFVIDDLDAQQPLYNGFVQLPAPASNGGSTGSGENALSLTGVRLEEEQVYINGKVGGALPRVAVIAMRGKTAEEPLFLSPVLAEDGGAFTIETAMPETAASGEYEVRATAYGMEGKQTDTIKYINKNDRDALVADVNAAETAEAVADILMEKREILGLLQDGALFTHIAQTVFEQKLYESYAALIAMLEQAQTVLAKLNAATGTEYSKLLSENPMILNGHADEAYYNDLSVAGKTAVNRKIVSSAPFESFATFRTAFAQAVAAYKQELESGGVQLEDGLVVWEFDSEEKCTLAKLTPDTTVTNMHDVSAKLTIDKTGDINGNTPSRDLVVDRQQYQYLNLVMYSNKATATEGTGINICIHDSSSYARAVLPVNWTGWKVVSIPLSAFAGTIDWNDVKYVKINSGGWSGSVTPVEIGTELNFDLIWFSKEEPSLTLKETIIESENDKMPVNGAEVSFWFSNSLRQVDETALTLTKQGEANSESVSCTVEGSSVTLEAQAELDYGTTYTLTIPSGAVIDIFGQSNTEPITYSFTTLQQGLNATLPTLTDSAGNPLSGRPTSGETIQAVARITNGSLEAKTATLVLVCYDENNRVLVRKTASKSIPANGADTLEVTTAASGAGVKAFVVDDLDSLRPLYNGFAQVPAPTSNGGTTGSGENPSLTLNDIRLEKEQVYITGKVEGALPRMAIIAIDGESAEELLFLSPVMAEDGGAFTMETTMPETAVGGEYEVRATAYSMEGKQTDTFYYFGKGERDALIAAVNAAENAETVTNLLTEKRDILDLPQDSALFTHIVQTVFEQKPYANYAAFAAMLEQAQTMLAKLNAATETEYSKLLSENPMILNGHADEAYYHNLSAKGKTAVNQKIVPIAPFESFATFRIVFARAVAAYKQELESGGIKLEDGLIVWEFDSAEKCTAVNLTPDTTVTNLYDVSAKLTIDRTGDISRNTPSQNLAVDTQQYQYLNLLVHSNKATTTEGTGINICIHDSSSYARTVLPVNWTGWKVVSIPFSKFAGTIDWNEVKYVKINSGGWSGSVKPVEIGTELNFDLIWFSKEEPNLKLRETVAGAGNTEMPVNGAAVSFRFSNSLRGVDETKLTLTKQGETNGESVSCTLKDGTVTITARSALEYRTTYILTVPSGAVTDIFGQSNTEPITYSFTTQGRGLSAMRPTLTDSRGIPLSNMPTGGETVKSSVQVNNGLDEEKTATLVVAFYDENNCMVDCKTVSKSIPANGTDTLTLTATATGTAVKAFVLDDLGSQQPLYNGFVQAPPASNGGTIGSGAQNKALTLTNVKLEGDRLSIEGKIDGELPCAAVLSVGGETPEKPLFLLPVLAENGGTFTVETTMPETAASGAYAVCATAYGINGKQAKTIYYVNKNEREALISAVNAAAAPEEIIRELENHRGLLGLPENSTLISHIAQTVFEQKPYADYAAFTALLEQAQTVLTELNATTWAGYSKILSENPIILNGHTDETYYNNLSATGKAEINRKIAPTAPFKSFAAFRTVFAQAVADYKKGLESGSSGGGNGGGSGGSSGGGRPGATSIGQVTLPDGKVPLAPDNNPTKPEKEERFTDLTAAEWARDSVERLYAAGAISAAAQFRPNDSVTREEFVKLMVESFGLTKGASATEFADVAADSWYAPYVAVVQSMGIVTGYEDGRFGVGEQITRQDMAVMLSRMLEILDVKLSEGNAEPFTDDGEISGYARSAVYLMRQAGVINGHDDGSFGPLQNASRAQAAKVLCGLLDLLAR